MKNSLHIIFLIVSLLFFLPVKSNTWLGYSNCWNSPDNWSSGHIPCISDSVFIDSGAAFYPLLKGDLDITVNSCSSNFASTHTFSYFCRYLKINPTASLNFDDSARTIQCYFATLEVRGTLNLSNGYISAPQGNIIIDSANVIAHGGISLWPPPSTSYLSINNSYLETNIIGKWNFFNATGSTIVSSLIYVSGAYFANCTLKLRKNGLISGYWQAIDADFNWGVNIENLSPQDDTVFIALSGFPFLGSLKFNTDNDCGLMRIESGFLDRSNDTAKIKGEVQIMNRGIIEFSNPTKVSGIISLNHGHIIKAWPGAINDFSSADSLMCTIHFAALKSK